MYNFFRPPRVRSAFPKLYDLIREIAQHSVAAVRRRLSDAVFTMSDAELRGYVRARALRPVRREAEQLAGEFGWRTGLNDPLVVNSLERTVHLVFHQLKTQPVVAPSAAHATLRAAG